MSRIRGKMNLAKLKSIVTDVKGKSGDVKCIIIPIEENNLFLGKNGAVYLDLIAFESDKIPDFTHSLKQSLPKEIQDKMKEDGVYSEFLGNLEYIGDTSGGAAVAESIPEASSEAPMEIPDGEEPPF